jgi:hypothetical protein
LQFAEVLQLAWRSVMPAMVQLTAEPMAARVQPTAGSPIMAKVQLPRMDSSLARGSDD